MNLKEKTILVFGATGQQGGAVAQSLRANGWQVKALVRDPKSDKAKVLDGQGIELVRGDFANEASIRAAIVGVHGVFSVQPSSGQGAAYGLTDEDEVRYGKAIADFAVAEGVSHLVYSSASAAGPTPTGMGHFDTKSEIEAYIRDLSINSTIIRPNTFMEILTLPGMGLDQGRFSFFMRPDQKAQFIAVEDIGKIVAAIFANPTKYAGQTLEIAGDAVTGKELEEKLSHAAGRPITYSRFPDSLLAENAFLGGIAELFDNGRLAGHTNITALRAEFPGLLTMDEWLEGRGKPALFAAMQSAGSEVALR